MKEVFQFKNPTYNFRSDPNKFISRKERTAYHGLYSVHLASTICDQVLVDIKHCGSLSTSNSFITEVPII